MDLLANSAASIIANHIPQELSEIIRINSVMLDGTPLNGYLRTLLVTRAKNDTKSKWSFVSGSSIELQAVELEELITYKEVKVEEYLQKCNRVWLIIVADGQRITSNADLTKDVRQRHFKSSFERVLFYNRLDQQIIPLS